MKPERWTIYCHTHVDSGRRYIGLTKQAMMKRWKNHVHAAQYSRGGRWYFPNAIRKYGKDAFSHEVLETHMDLDQANLAEEWFIRLFNTRDPRFGFNLAPGGTHVPHPKKNPMNQPEFREKALRNLAKANNISSEERSERTRALWQDDDYREKVSVVLRSNMADPEVKGRATQAMKESFATDESKAKRSTSSKAMWQSDDFRARNAELWQDPEFRDRCESGLRRGASVNRVKTHCPNGHPYSEENVMVNSKGSRECLICSRASKRESARRRRLALKQPSSVG